MRRIASALLIALTLIAALTAPRSSARADDVDDAIARMQSGTRRERVLAIRTAEGRTDDRIVEALIGLLASPEFAVSNAAVEMLGKLGADAGAPRERAVTALRSLVGEGAKGTLRGEAFRALARLGDTDSVPAMLAALATEPGRSSAVSGALRALEILRLPSTFDGVAKRYAAQPDDPYVFPHAGLALVAIDAERAVPFLLARFAEAESAELSSVAEALSLHSDPRTIETLLPRLAIDDVRRRAAVRVLAAIGGPAAHDVLLAHGDAHAEDRATTAHYLPATAAALAGPRLVEWLRASADNDTVGAIAEALGRFGSPEALRPLAGIVGTRPPDQALVLAIEALGEIGDARAIATLAGRLEDDTHVPQPGEISSILGFPHNVRIREAAAWALVTLRDGAAPCERSRLSRFRDHGERDDVDAVVTDARTWWRAHQADARYRLD